ncbi:MAG: hypothetical protein KC609_06380, partial [Myxococcales bacterium]|nr:hypothetical protein [Myxococcales bacterium]
CIQGVCRPARYRSVIAFAAWNPYVETLDDAERNDACKPLSGSLVAPDRCDTVCCFSGTEPWPVATTTVYYSSPPQNACQNGCYSLVGSPRTLPPRSTYAPTTRGWCDDNQKQLPNTAQLGLCDKYYDFRFQGTCDHKQTSCPAGVCEQNDEKKSVFVGERQSCDSPPSQFYGTGPNNVEFEAVCCKKSDGNYVAIGVQKTISASTTFELTAVAPGKLTIGLEQRFDRGTIWDGAPVALYEEASPGSSRVTLSVSDCVGPSCGQPDAVVSDDLEQDQLGPDVETPDLGGDGLLDTSATSDLLEADTTLDQETPDLTSDLGSDSSSTVCTPGQSQCKDSDTLEVCNLDGTAWVSVACSGQSCTTTDGVANCTLNLATWQTVHLANPGICVISAKDPLAASYTFSDQNKTAVQTMNAPPSTLLHSAVLSNVRIHGRLRVTSKTSPDDDFIGFIFGFDGAVVKQQVKHPSTSETKLLDLLDKSTASSFYVVDWKRATQTSNENGFASLGISIKLVQKPQADELNCREFWDPKDPASPRVQTLFDASDLPIAWEFDTDYDFELVFYPDGFSVRFSTAGEPLAEISVDWLTNTIRYRQGHDPAQTISPIPLANPQIREGRFGFYNFSQDKVSYSSFTLEPLCTGSSSFCVGDTLKSCKADKSGYDDTDCRTSGLVCADGPGTAACRFCQPGTTRCNGDAIETCNADGTAYEAMNCRLGCMPSAPVMCVPENLHDFGGVQFDPSNSAGVTAASYTFVDTPSLGFGLEERANNDAAFLLQSTDYPASTAIRLRATIRPDSDADAQPDMFGLVFGYKDDANFLLYMWKGGEQSSQDCGIAQAGMSVKLFHTTIKSTNCADFFSTGQESPTPVLDPARVGLLWYEATDNPGWVKHTSYTLQLDIRPDSPATASVTIRVLGGATNKTITLSGVPYTGGKLGFYFQGEPHTHVEAVNIATLP